MRDCSERLRTGRYARLKRIDARQNPRHTEFVEGTGGAGLSEQELVESVLRDLAEAADRWEALLAQAETVIYSVDMGDIRAVANSDGKLVDLVLAPGITADYTHSELAGRLNTAFAALRNEVEDDYLTRYAGEVR